MKSTVEKIRELERLAIAGKIGAAEQAFMLKVRVTARHNQEPIRAKELKTLEDEGLSFWNTCSWRPSSWPWSSSWPSSSWPSSSSWPNYGDKCHLDRYWKHFRKINKNIERLRELRR